MQQIIEFVSNNLVLFAALIAVLVMLIKAELDHQTVKGLFISPSNAIRLMNNNEDALVVDIRTATDYKAGHIKGARSAPLNELAASIKNYSTYKDKPVLVYCNSGNSIGRAIKVFKKAGFEKINTLDGGIAAWREAKMPLAHD